VARAAAAEYAGQVDTLENAARAMLGDTAGVEGDGWRITWTKNADSTKVYWEQVAIALRRLVLESITAGLLAPNYRETVDAIETMYTEVKPGPRVLRVKGL